MIKLLTKRVNQTGKTWQFTVKTLAGSKVLRPAGYPQRCRGRFALSTTRCGFHPPVARREAPHNQRIQQTIPPANKFAFGLAPDPQR